MRAEEKDLLSGLSALVEGIPHPVSNMANAAACLFRALPDVSWVGFYLLEGDKLVLGPFQGKPACIEIPAGKGVCGACAASGKPLCVPDVLSFPGHIACDPDSRSELVLPLMRDGKVFGVLDLDSKTSGRFGEEDRTLLEACAEILIPWI
ncbi:MAG: GAF domain-containing protein [Clostridia bacterium]|nr:GAF domain-containing protein [Clostridia bacterium]